jgi:hypothetical protein
MEQDETGYKRLTAKDVRKALGFEKKTDQEVQTIILALEKLAALLYRRFTKQKPPE